MRKKYYSSILTLLLIIIILFTSQNKPSYSLELNKIINLNLEYTSNEEQLETNLYNFINQIDDTLIPLFEYNEDLNLNDNYQFLTRFALTFIANNLPYYESQIVLGDTYQYYDDYGQKIETDQYVSLDLIYDITNSVFDRRYYYITNQELTITDNLVPLIIENYPIEMNLEKIINITTIDNTLFATVKYAEIDVYYQYEFAIKESKLTIRNLNIEV